MIKKLLCGFMLLSSSLSFAQQNLDPAQYLSKGVAGIQLGNTLASVKAKAQKVTCTKSKAASDTMPFDSACTVQWKVAPSFANVTLDTTAVLMLKKDRVVLVRVSHAGKDTENSFKQLVTAVGAATKLEPQQQGTVAAFVRTPSAPLSLDETFQFMQKEPFVTVESFAELNSVALAYGYLGAAFALSKMTGDSIEP